MSLELAWIVLLTLAYGLIHSWLASRVVKQWVNIHVPGQNALYRLIYNLLAFLLLLPILWLLWRYTGTDLWQWTGAWQWLANGLALLALLGFVLSLRDYDLGEFMGTRQLRCPAAESCFRLGFFHRYVRHPWYCFGLVILWTRDINAADLYCYGIFTLYLLIGCRLEELKLLAEFGEPYRRYQQKVPALLPLPWRHLSAAEARELEAAVQAASL